MISAPRSLTSINERSSNEVRQDYYFNRIVLTYDDETESAANDIVGSPNSNDGSLVDVIAVSSHSNERSSNEVRQDYYVNRIVSTNFDETESAANDIEGSPNSNDGSLVNGIAVSSHSNDVLTHNDENETTEQEWWEQGSVVTGSLIDEESLHSEGFHVNEVPASDVVVVDDNDSENTPVPVTVDNISIYDGQLVNNHSQLQMKEPICLFCPSLTYGRLIVLLFMVVTIAIALILVVFLVGKDSYVVKPYTMSPTPSPMPYLPSSTPSLSFPPSSKHALIQGWSGIDIFTHDKDIGWPVALSSDGNILLVGGYGVLRVFNIAFEKSDLIWSHTEDQTSDSPNFFFAAHISPDGSYLATSHSVECINCNGFVIVFRCTDSYKWEQHGRKLTGDSDYDGFGTSLAISDNGRLAVGAVFDNYVSLYYTASDDWIMCHQLEGEVYSSFGTAISMSVDGSVLIVSAPSSNSNRGDIFVYDIFTGAPP